MSLRNLLFKDNFMYGVQRRKITKSFLSSLLSIVIALIVALLVATLMGYNPLDIFIKLFYIGWDDYTNLFYIFGVFCLAGLAFVVTSRAGIFNIGISGQMLGSGTCVIFFVKFLNDLNVADNIPNGVGQLLIIIIAMAAGSIFAMIIGSLDVYLKVNSVVSSILLNWVIYFVSFYLLATFARNDGDELISSISVPDNFRLVSNITGTGGLIPIIVIVVVVSALIAILFKFTVLGHKIKSVGLSIDASKYAGYKIKTIKMLSFGLSGCISGLLACVSYTSGANALIPLSTSLDSVPIEGFDGIAISLIGNNNPIGIILISMLFALFKNSLSGIVIPPSYINVLIGLIMLCAALSIVIVKWRPWLYIKSFKYNREYYKFQEDFDNKYNALISKYKSIIKYEKKNVYKQSIKRDQKKKLWLETLNEIKQDYLIEKSLMINQFDEIKFNLLIDKKLNFKKIFKDKYEALKNEIDVSTIKKMSKYQEKIQNLEFKIMNQKNNQSRKNQKLIKHLDKEIEKLLKDKKILKNKDALLEKVKQLKDKELIEVYRTKIENISKESENVKNLKDINEIEVNYA